jgi:hypothetical protein
MTSGATSSGIRSRSHHFPLTHRDLICLLCGCCLGKQPHNGDTGTTKSIQMKILRPQEVRAEAVLGDELNADFFAPGGHGVIVSVKLAVCKTLIQSPSEISKKPSMSKAFLALSGRTVIIFFR